jgi:hypothetical protein
MGAMLKINKALLATFSLVLLSGCAKDMIIHYENDSAIRLMGGANNFDCRDPAFAKIKKIQTWSLEFSDGTRIQLCTPVKPQTQTNFPPLT